MSNFHQLLEAIATANEEAADSLFHEALNNKVTESLEVRKVELASSIMEGGPTRKHFRQTAELLKNIEDPAKRKEMAHHHASLFAQQNPRFNKDMFLKASGVNEAADPADAQAHQNVQQNIRRAISALKLRGVNAGVATQGHKDFSNLLKKNPKQSAVNLLRKLSPQRAAAVQSLSQAGVPLGGALASKPTDFNQALQRIKRFN